MKNIFLLVLLLGSLFATQATYDAIDFSNLDLLNFEYFKNFPSIDYSRATILEPINQHFLRKKAIFNYLRNLLLGNSGYERIQDIKFDPKLGERLQPLFEKYYGYRGENLIELLGKGVSPKLLNYYGAVSNHLRH